MLWPMVKRLGLSWKRLVYLHRAAMAFLQCDGASGSRYVQCGPVERNLHCIRLWERLAEILRFSAILGLGSGTFCRWFSELSGNVFTQLCTVYSKLQLPSGCLRLTSRERRHRWQVLLRHRRQGAVLLLREEARALRLGRQTQVCFISCITSLSNCSPRKWGGGYTRDRL